MALHSSRGWAPRSREGCPQQAGTHLWQGPLVGFSRRAPHAVAGFATSIAPHQSPSDASHDVAGRRGSRARGGSIRLVTRSGRTRATAPNSPTNGRLAARAHIPMDEKAPLGQRLLLSSPVRQKQPQTAAKQLPPPTHGRLYPRTMAETLSADAINDAVAPGGIDSGHTAWILMSCALVRSASSYELPLTLVQRRSTS